MDFQGILSFMHLQSIQKLNCCGKVGTIVEYVAKDVGLIRKSGKCTENLKHQIKKVGSNRNWLVELASARRATTTADMQGISSDS